MTACSMPPSKKYREMDLARSETPLHSQIRGVETSQDESGYSDFGLQVTRVREHIEETILIPLLE